MILAALLMRLSLGVVMIAHGYNHLFGAGGLAGTTRWFASMGLRPARVHALLSGLTELVAGTCVVLGFLTSLQCAAIVGVMLVAFVTAHRTNGFFVFRPGQGWEYVGFITLVAVALAALGPSDVSVDHLLGIARDLDGGVGAGLAAAGGTSGAAVLLLTCWRPQRAD